MIDLHIHSVYSDGTDDIEALLTKAQNSNLKYLSVTDHDTCDFYIDLEKVDISKYYAGEIIRGVELTAIVNGIQIELLGYGIDPYMMNKYCNEMYVSKTQKNMILMSRLYKRVVSLGLKLDKNLLEKYPGNYKYPSNYIFENINKHKENRKFFSSDAAFSNATVFFRRCISNPNSKFFIDMSDVIPDYTIVAQAIKKCGGKVFIPHVYIYRENTEKVLYELVSSGLIDGIECYYSLFSNEQTKELLEFCKNNNLYISGGTDYHGKRKQNLLLGKGYGDMSVPKEILFNWLDNSYLINNDEDLNYSVS